MKIMTMLNREHGITILNITHYMDEAAQADRVIVINDGSVYMDGTPTEVFSRIDEIRAVGLEAPQTIELMDALRRNGCDLSLACLDEAACVDALVRLYEEGQA